MKAIGLDIGTTTICGILIDAASGQLLDSRTLPNDAAMASAAVYERLQDPVRITAVCEALVEEWCAANADIRSIGLTGQMHGILYVDRNGLAVSPLHTWQDERGNVRIGDEATSAEHLSWFLQQPMATGFGLVTHAFNAMTKQVPPDTTAFCAIQDYVGMRLTGRRTPLVHFSDAASFGGFSLQAGDFDRKRLTKAGIDERLLPEVCGSLKPLGVTARGIPVCIAIGDNQASYLGSAADDDALLVNIGTGGQISSITDASAGAHGIEVRPLDGGARISVGCTLCAGDAYALLRDFFRSFLRETGLPADNLYALMDRMAESVPSGSDGIRVDTRFRGTRSDPSLRGAMSNLTRENFTPGHLALGFLTGIGGELRDLYRIMTAQGMADRTRHRRLIGSGNGIRNSALMRRTLTAQFGLPLSVPLVREEAAYGAALSSLAPGGACGSLAEARRLIRYE